MSLRTVVTYFGNLAHYEITPESFGVYHARLLKYEGAKGATPPENVLLVKGDRHWVSSCEEQPFTDNLGRAIERRVRQGHPFS